MNSKIEKDKYTLPTSEVRGISYSIMRRNKGETQWIETENFTRLTKSTAKIHCALLRKLYPNFYRYKVARVSVSKFYEEVKF